MIYVKKLQSHISLLNADRSLIGEDVVVRISRSGFSLSYLPAAQATWLFCPEKDCSSFNVFIQLGAFLDGNIIGTCCAFAANEFWLEIKDIRVDSQFRRMGAGKAMIDACMAHALRSNLAGLRIVTNDRNANMCQFCEHTGFSLQGIDRLAEAVASEELGKPLAQRTCQLIFYRQKG